MKRMTGVLVAALVTLSAGIPTVVSQSSDLSSEQMPPESTEQESSELSGSIESAEQMPLELSSSKVETSGSGLGDSGADLTTESTTQTSEETTGYSSEESTPSSLSSDPSPTSGSSATEDSPLDSTKDSNTESESSEESTTKMTETETSTKETTSDGTFSDEQKSVWIDRHNYFRVTGLPWAAGDMKRMNWDDSLAQDAATAATSCTAKTGPGLNVYEGTSLDTATILEDAVAAWIVQPALDVIGNVVPPAKEGDSVGAGLYNSYTQVVWSLTTGVGCATASCSGGTMVACAYSPPGNDGTSPWFFHAAQATSCPSGTTAQHGLCTVEGDPKNKLIAPIPDGLWTFQMYPNFVADIKEAILKAAKARDVPGAKPMAAIVPSGSLDSDNYEEEDGPLQLGSCAGSTTKSSPEDSEVGELTSEEDPGTVKASSAADSSLENQALSLSTESEEQSDEVIPLSVEKTDILAFSASESTTPPDSGMSTASIAALVALGVAAVAAFAVFVNYRRKQYRQQQQQREIELLDRVEII